MYYNEGLSRGCYFEREHIWSHLCPYWLYKLCVYISLLVKGEKKLYLFFPYLQKERRPIV